MTPEPRTLFLGLTAIDIATLLAAVATFAAMTAVWAVMTVRDPMRGRVKALQDRREQLKAGIVASRKRARLVPRNSTHVQLRHTPTSMSGLQDNTGKAPNPTLEQTGKAAVRERGV